MKSVVDVLKRYGATEIEGYVLISNYGYTFKIGEKKYDARYWANSYGCALDVWMVHSCTPRADDPRFYEQVDPELKSNLERKLNEIGGR